MEKPTGQAGQHMEPTRRSSAWKIAVVTDKETTKTIVFPLAEELNPTKEENKRQ